MNENHLATILRSNHSVFTFKDVTLLWGETDPRQAKKRIYRYVKAGKLYSIRRGIYAKDRNYDRLELANKIFSPSYISFETVLAKEGIIFQHYDQLFAASYLTREITCDGGVYSFRRLKSTVLANSLGIEIKPNYSIASKERAFLDTLYLNPEYHFDNLSPIDWNKCREILPIYGNKALAKRFESYTGLSQNA
jgi:predicted transcriptional regulator of viral defense system